MSANIEIRPVCASDRSELAEMYCRLNTETFVWMPPNSFNVQDFEKDTIGEKILVSVIGDQLVGFVSVKLSENLVHHLYVDSKTQGQGLGKKLLDAGISLIDKMPVYLNCRAKNERALNFYMKYGFKIDARITMNSDSYFKLKMEN